MGQKEFVVDTKQLEGLSSGLAAFPKELRSAMRSSLTAGIRNSLLRIVPRYYAIDKSTLAGTYKVRDWRSSKQSSESIHFEVAGRRLTLSHFKFFPKEEQATRPIIEVIRDQAKRASPQPGEDGKLKTPFVKHTGAKDTSKVQMNVFIRSGRPQQKDPKKEVLRSYRTVSVPQMLGHDAVAGDVQDNMLSVFNARLLPRIEKATGVLQQNITKG